MNSSIQQQLDLGRTISESTLTFWFRQDRDVIEKQLRPSRRVEYVVSKGPAFDARYQHLTLRRVLRKLSKRHA